MAAAGQTELEKWLAGADPSQSPLSEGFREPVRGSSEDDACKNYGDESLDVDGFRVSSLPISDAPLPIASILKRLETMELELTAIDSRDINPEAGFKLEPFKLEVRSPGSACNANGQALRVCRTRARR